MAWVRLPALPVPLVMKQPADRHRLTRLTHRTRLLPVDLVIAGLALPAFRPTVVIRAMVAIQVMVAIRPMVAIQVTVAILVVVVAAVAVAVRAMARAMVLATAQVMARAMVMVLATAQAAVRPSATQQPTLTNALVFRVKRARRRLPA